MNMTNSKLIALLTGFLLSVSQIQFVEAAWWKFGLASDEPEITELKFNAVDTFRVEDDLTLGREELDGGVIVVRGQVEIEKGKVGKVELSWDGGEHWVAATLGDRGNFTAEFQPELEQEYQFQIKALSTTGKSSDIDDHTFAVSVTSVNSSEAVRQVFQQLLQAYQREDRIAFMDLVSEDFEGSLSALEDAIEDDFRYFDNIRLDVHITRVIPFDGNFEVYFTFNRQVQSVRSGSLLIDRAASTVVFSRGGDSFQLQEMAAPLIFGLSDPLEVATSVTEESIGQQVITVDSDGQVALGEQGDSVDAATEEDVETLVSTDAPLPFLLEGFNFADAEMFTNPPDIGDMILQAGVAEFFPEDSFAQDLGAGSLDSVSQVPASGYLKQPYSLVVGHVYAFRLLDNTYAIMEVTSVVVDASARRTTLTFRYKHQPNGSRQF